jgi:primosomal protein N' (replication factor Y)
VIAPLRSRRLVGVVWALRDDPEAERDLKPIEEILDCRPFLSQEQIEFAEWMARYYYASLPAVLKLFLPGLHTKPDRLTVIRSEQAAGDVDETERVYLENLPPARPIKAKTLRSRLGSPSGFYRQLDMLEYKGLIHIGATLKRKGANASLKARLIAVPDKIASLGSKQREIVSLLQKSPQGIRLQTLSKRLKASGQSLQRLVDRKIIELVSFDASVSHSPQELILNREQMDAAEAVSPSVAKGEFDVFLLHGVTGSGKTEVYIRLIWDAIERGKSALLLQPEIALSEQIYSSLRVRFGERVCRLHSGLSDAERFETFRRIRAGRIRIVIGPRSAMFSPLRDLGVVIVDEEHDHSYKQAGSAPYYQGRDAAVMLARICSCPVLLGSATPSVESWGNARSGKYKLITVTARWDDKELPDIKLIGHQPDTPRASPLSWYLAERISDCLDTGAQVVLFLNRRGFSPTVKCRNCRHTFHCPNCDIGLVFHKGRNEILCHLCGHRAPVPKVCPECGGVSIGYYGAGTQKIEEYLKDTYPDAKLGRLDVDVATSVKAAAGVLDNFRKGKTDILVGTQMVAKGFNFPNVRLVGILSADTSLSLPDFRAAERTHALIYQAAGRAGRGKFRGEVIVQVECEDSPLFIEEGEIGFASFLDKELIRREELGYPPFKHLILLRLKSGSARRVEGAAFEMQKKLAGQRKAYESFMTVLGPSPAPFFRVKNNYRWRLMIKTSSVSSSLKFMDQFLKEKSTRSCLRQVHFVVDVDPYDML